MEQVLVRNLADGTKAALRARARQNNRSLEAEIRSVLEREAAASPRTIVDVIAMPDSIRIEFEPERLNLTARVPEL